MSELPNLDMDEMQEYFCIKKNGKLQAEGLTDNARDMMRVGLNHRGISVICDSEDQDCDCVSDAWEQYSNGATVVPVFIVESKGKGH